MEPLAVHGVRSIVKSGSEKRTAKRGGDRPREDRRAPSLATAGLAARQLAVTLISAVTHEKRALDEVWLSALASRTFAGLDPRDRAFARLIAGTVLRRHGELTAVLATFLDKALPERRGRLDAILLSGAAQLLLLDTPRHAAISLAVDQCRLDRDATRFDKLVNAVLRRVAEHGEEIRAGLDSATLNVPSWLLERWQATFGAEQAQLIAMASLREAPLDLSVKDEAAARTETLGGQLLATNTIRMATHGRIEDIPGYDDGTWWVQDAAAALPPRLLGNVDGRDVADLCAAPGGKTISLAAAGARVTAVDTSQKRLRRVRENLDRMQLDASLVIADAATWAPDRTFDAVLLDAPCSATGTIRRHPDILHLKRPTDITALAEVQAKVLKNAANLVRPGGLLVYCTCSLEPEEGVAQIEDFLAAHPEFQRLPIAAGEYGIAAEWLSAAGDLRTLPQHLPLDPPELSGMDGFYAARLIRQA